MLRLFLMKRIRNPRNTFLLLLLVFFVINLLQSHFTGLFEDEAYYWVWSGDLAWGYFDHPPMVALWIYLGRILFEGEIGMRLLSATIFPLLLVILWLTVDHKNKWDQIVLFFFLIISVVLLQAFGFIITPDTPLLFFVSLFFLAYKLFLREQNLLHSLLLGVAMAGMLYSKYHGILVIAFVLLSNWKLLRSPWFWGASLFGLLLFIPHLWWQYENGFPSFLYHLYDRAKKPYNPGKTLLHFVNMIAVVGITFPLIYKALYLKQTTNVFERGLKYTVYGFFIFFFLATFGSAPQAQWLAAALIPLILLVFPYFIEHKKDARWLRLLGSIQLLLIVFARIFLAFPEVSPLKLEPHWASEWVPELHSKTQERPLVFVNSYKSASIYEFYTGIPTHSYSVLKGRKSQYNLLGFEDRMQGKDVYGVGKLLEDQPKIVLKDGDPLYGNPIENYTTFEKVHCIIETESLHLTPGDMVNFTFRMTNTYPKSITFENVTFYGVFQGKKNKILEKVPLEIKSPSGMAPLEEREFQAEFTVPEIQQEKEITFRVALEFYDLMEGYQGNKITVRLDRQD